MQGARTAAQRHWHTGAMSANKKFLRSVVHYVGSRRARYARIPIQSAPLSARFQLLNILNVCLRRLNLRRLDGISDLKLEVDGAGQRMPLTSQLCNSRHYGKKSSTK
jgi:hypothetical protein